MAFAETAKLTVDLSLTGNFQSGLSKSQSALTTFDSRLSRTTSRASRAFSNLGKNLKSALASPLGAIGLSTGILGVGLAFKKTVDAAVDWESAFAGVRKTTNASTEELAKLEQGLRDAAKTMPITAENLAAIAEAGGALGIATPDLLEFTKVVALIGTTTNVSTDAAATALGQLGNVLGLTGKDFERFASTLVKLGNTGASTESEILEITRRSGGAAKLIGLAADQTLSWASAAANLGIQQELAGTSLQKLYLQTLNLVNNKGGLKELAKVAGTSAEAFKTAFKKDASGALESFLRGLGKLPADQRLQTVQDLFGKTSGLTRLILGLAASVDKNLDPALENGSKAWKENTAAAREAQIRYNTTASAFQIFANNVHDAAITIGAELLPQLADLSKEGVAWITTHQPEIKEFAKALAGAVKGVVGIAKTAVGVAKNIADAWGTIPPELRDILVKGFIADRTIKFLFGFSPTGALASGIAGAISKALGAGVAGTILSRGFVQPVFVTNWGGMPGGGLPGGGGGGGGLLATASKLIIPVTIAAITVEAAGALARAIDPTATGPGKETLVNRDPRRFDQYGRVIQNSVETGAKSGTEKGIKLLDTFDRNKPGAEGGTNRGSDEPMQDTFDRRTIVQPISDSFDRAVIPVRKSLDGLQSTLPDSFDRAVMPATAAVNDTKGAVDSTRDQLSGDLTANKATIEGTRSQLSTDLGSNASRISMATYGAGAGIEGAIRANRPIINVDVNISATTVRRTVTVNDRYGSPDGDRYGSGDLGGPGHPGR